MTQKEVSEMLGDNLFFDNFIKWYYNVVYKGGWIL